MSKDKTFGEVLNDFIKEPKRHFKLHFVYTDGTDDFDRYDEMETVDTFLETSEDVMNHLLNLVERGGLEDYCIVDLNRGLKYREVSSFIADCVPYSRQKFYWRAFLNRDVDTTGCKSHLYDTATEDKGSGRPIELPQDSETPTPTESNAIISFTLDVDKIDLRYLKDCAIILVDAINRVDTCNQEQGSIKHDLSLMNRLLKFVNTAIEYKEKSQKEDEDYQLYLKLKERFEGGK